MSVVTAAWCVGLVATPAVAGEPAKTLQQQARAAPAGALASTAPPPSSPTAFAKPSQPAHPPEAVRVERVPILMYHHVQELTGEPGAVWLRYTVSPTQFAAQLDWLSAHGFQTITTSELVGALRGGAELPTKPVALTFDDGWECCHSVVLPMLRARHMTASFFVYPSGIGAPGYLSWKQLRELCDAGMEIGAHSMSHPSLAAIAPEQANAEITVCRDVLRQNLGVAPSVFAYPFGEYHPGTCEMVQRAGYAGALTTDPGVDQRSDDLLRLKRVLVEYPDKVERFAAVVEPPVKTDIRPATKVAKQGEPKKPAG